MRYLLALLLTCGLYISLPADHISHVEQAPAPRKVRQIHGICVGVDVYDEKENAFTSDARNIACVLGTDKIFLNEEATKENVLNAIKSLKPDPDDLVVIFFSAHGSIEDDYYIMLHGGTLPDWKRHVLWGKQLKKALNKLPCPSVLALDTCHAAAMLRHKMPNTTVLAACGDEESSYGDPEGPFAAALRESFSLEADYDWDGYVSMWEMASYVKFYTAKYAEIWQSPESRVPKHQKYLTLPLKK